MAVQNAGPQLHIRTLIWRLQDDIGSGKEAYLTVRYKGRVCEIYSRLSAYLLFGICVKIRVGFSGVVCPTEGNGVLSSK